MNEERLVLECGCVVVAQRVTPELVRCWLEPCEEDCPTAVRARLWERRLAAPFN